MNVRSMPNGSITRPHVAMQDKLRSMIHLFTETSPLNRFRYDKTMRFFDAPLIGCANGDDPVFDEFKKAVCATHMTPREFYKNVYPQHNPRHLTVLSLVFPQTKEVRDANRNQGRWDIPAYDWIDAKARGGEFQSALNSKIAAFFAKYRINCISSDNEALVYPTFHWEDNFHVDVTWSERHVAYACGLGTFGLCGGLITEKGKAVRCGSLVIATQLPATPRPYKTHTEYCLFYRDGSCMACAHRCPVGAISEKGKDTRLCKLQSDEGVPKIMEQYSIDQRGCGFCQLNVPCESGIPGYKIEEKTEQSR